MQNCCTNMDNAVKKYSGLFILVPTVLNSFDNTGTPSKAFQSNTSVMYHSSNVSVMYRARVIGYHEKCDDNYTRKQDTSKIKFT